MTHDPADPHGYDAGPPTRKGGEADAASAELLDLMAKPDPLTPAETARAHLLMQGRTTAAPSLPRVVRRGLRRYGAWKEGRNG